jgi:hypothetical protein
VRRLLVALLIAAGLAASALPNPARANPIYEPFCVYEQPPQGPMVTVCTPD